MNEPTIAVVMPAYNEADRIDQTIATIARYRARNPSIQAVIVADDGSTDGTGDVVRRAATREGVSVEVLTLPHRGKALAVRAAMLDVADRVTADYLMMLDADDELQIDQLDRVDWSVDRRTVYIGRRIGSIGTSPAGRPSPVRRAMSLAMRVASRVLLGIRFPTRSAASSSSHDRWSRPCSRSSAPRAGRSTRNSCSSSTASPACRSGRSRWSGVRGARAGCARCLRR